MVEGTAHPSLLYVNLLAWLTHQTAPLIKNDFPPDLANRTPDRLRPYFGY